MWYFSASPFSAGGLSFEPAAHVDGKANVAIYRSAGGAAWERLRGGLPEPMSYMAYALLTDPIAPGHVYAGMANGDVWHSPDYGDNWKMLSFNLRGIHSQLFGLFGRRQLPAYQVGYPKSGCGAAQQQNRCPSRRGQRK